MDRGKHRTRAAGCLVSSSANGPAASSIAVQFLVGAMGLLPPDVRQRVIQGRVNDRVVRAALAEIGTRFPFPLQPSRSEMAQAARYLQAPSGDSK